MVSLSYFLFSCVICQKHKVMEQRKIIIGSIIVCALFVGVFMCAQSIVSLHQLLQVNGERTGEHYTLVWQEDFSGTQLDSTKWSLIPRKPWQPFWNICVIVNAFNIMEMCYNASSITTFFQSLCNDTEKTCA